MRGVVNVDGIEPFLEYDIEYENGLVIKKAFLADVKKKYDIIFYDNVFEHLESPASDMMIAKSKLNMDGKIVCIFPGYGDMTRKFCGNSYIIQPPQHVALYTEQGIRRIAERAELKVIEIKKTSIYEWYLKSYWIEKGLMLTGKYYRIPELEKKVHRKALSEIKKSIEKNKDGDFYTVVFGV
jgi:hypothetical protein